MVRTDTNLMASVLYIQNSATRERRPNLHASGPGMGRWRTTMTDYDRILLTTRRNELEAIARHHQAWMEARRALAESHDRAPGSAPRGVAGLPGIRSLLGLRGNARRGLKGRRSLA